MTTRPTLDRVWASTAPASSIQDPDTHNVGKVARGWEAEIPPFQWFNWIQKRNDEFKLALAERGVASWGTDVSYNKGSLVFLDDDGLIYLAKQANKGSKPSPSSPVWVRSAASITQEQVDDLEKSINDHISNEGNPHSVTAEQVDAYTKAAIDALLTSNLEELTKHETDYTNPHKVTAAQAGGVPITGGTYTGAITSKADSFRIKDGSGTDIGIISEGSGVALMKGVERLGITDAQVPYYKDKSGTSYDLLYEGNFAELKLQHESDYAVPTPDFYMPLSIDINIYEGDGYSLFTRPTADSYINKLGKTVVAPIDEPRFEAGGILLAKESLDIHSQILPVGDWTLTLTIGNSKTMAKPCGGDLIHSIGDAFYLKHNSTGFQNKLRCKSGGVIHDFPLEVVGGQYVTISLANSANSCRVYADGKLIGILPTIASDLGNVWTLGWYSGDVRCLRTWNLALTPEQLSTL